MKPPLRNPPQMAKDGFRTISAPINLPHKIQGGYQAPSGGQRPNLPTVGSGVKTPSAPAPSAPTPSTSTPAAPTPKTR